MEEILPKPQLLSTPSSSLAQVFDITHQRARQALNVVNGNFEDAVIFLGAPESTGTVTFLHIDESECHKTRRNIYIECLDIRCPYVQPVDINLFDLCNEIECSELFTRIEDDILGDLPSDCDFTIVFNEVVCCCKKFLGYVARTNFYHKNRLIDYVICDHDCNEVPYSVFIEDFFNNVSKILNLSSFSFDDCHQCDMIAIRHGIQNLELLQNFLECYATNTVDLEPVVRQLLHNVIVDQTLTVFDVSHALYGNRFLYESTRACVFRNTYNLCVARGIRFSHTMLQCYLKEFFEQYDRLRDFIFTDQRSILSVVRHAKKGDDDAFATFVGVIIDGLICQRSENRLFYSDFLLKYTQRVNPSFACRSRHRYLFRELTSFMKVNSYESKPLDQVFCHLLRYELAAMKLEKERVHAFLELRGESISELTLTSNTQQGRYIVEVALLVIRGIICDLQIAVDGGETSREFSLRSHLFLFLELIDKSHVQYVLAFDYCSSVDNSESYLDSPNYLHLTDTVIKLFSQNSAAFEISQKLHYDGNNTRSPLCLLHTWVYVHAKDFRHAISTELHSSSNEEDCCWYVLFISIFDHIKKFGAKWSKEGRLNVTHPTNAVLSVLYKSFSYLRAEINPDAFRVKQTGNFYNQVLDILSKQIQLLPSSEEVDSGLKRVTQQTTSLRLALSKTRHPDMVNWVDYSKVEPIDLNVIMHDDGTSDVQICGEQANEFLLNRIVNKYAEDSGRRLSLYGQSILALKARFDVTTLFFKKHVDDLKKCLDASRFLEDYKCSDVVEAILALQSEIVNTELSKLNLVNLAEDERHKTLLTFFHGYDSLAERRIAAYKYSLLDMWTAFCRHNPGASLNHKFDDVHVFKRSLESNFCGKYPGDINNFENNQVVALFALKNHFECKDSLKPMMFHIGTGQGKTLTEAALAIEFLQLSKARQSDCKSRVIILTAFSHLAKRDKASMNNMYRQFGFTSIVIDSQSDAENFRLDGADIIYADSQALTDCIMVNAMSANPNGDLMEFAFGHWADHLVILDEVDILLKKKELLYVRDCFNVFDDKNLKTALQRGKYSTINAAFDAEGSVAAALLSNASNDGVSQNEANVVIRYVSSLGAQIDSKKLSLYGACFSWKAKLFKVSKNVIGFSGTLDPHTFGVTCAPYFDNSRDAFVFMKIPLFFSPESQYGDVSCRRVFAEADQLSWLNSAIDRGETPKIPSSKWCRSLDQKSWIDTIKLDCDEAKANGQAVLVFAYINAENTPTCDFNLLKHSIGADKYYDNEASPSDSDLQSVATNGRVTLCCKKVGRGADVRVPPSMQEGLHVIVASPDYMEEMMQQIGRTGRMNRRGSYSFIFKTGTSEPPYIGAQESAEKNQLYRFGMHLSDLYYKARHFHTRKYFFWFIYVLLSYGERKFLSKSQDEKRMIKNQIEHLLTNTVMS
jgi:hypothetical protein